MAKSPAPKSLSAVAAETSAEQLADLVLARMGESHDRRAMSAAGPRGQASMVGVVEALLPPGVNWRKILVNLARLFLEALASQQAPPEPAPEETPAGPSA